MATTKWYFILLQLIIFGYNKINSQTLSTVPCEPVLQNYFDYFTMPHTGTTRYLSIQATFILENSYVAYYTGSLTYDKPIDSLTGTVTVSYSDRTWPVSCALFFCSYQNFNYNETDTQTIVINKSGSIQYTLNSGGNAKVTDQLHCYGKNEPLYTAPTNQSASMFVMTLQEQEYTTPT